MARNSRAILDEALSAGAFAPRKVIVIGEQSHHPSSRTILEMQRCGYTPMLEIAQEELVTTEISPKLRATIHIGRSRPPALNQQCRRYFY